LTQLTGDFDVPAQLGNLEFPLPGIEWPVAVQDILLMSHSHLHSCQGNVLFAGHAHERDNCSIGQTGLQEGKGVEAFILTVKFFWFIADKNVSRVE